MMARARSAAGLPSSSGASNANTTDARPGDRTRPPHRTRARPARTPARRFLLRTAPMARRAGRRSYRTRARRQTRPAPPAATPTTMPAASSAAAAADRARRSGSGGRSRQRDRHERLGDPVVEAAFDVDQPVDPGRHHRVDHHARAQCGAGRASAAPISSVSQTLLPASTKMIGAVTSNRSSLRVLSEGGDEDGLDGVQAVLGLVEDDAGR